MCRKGDVYKGLELCSVRIGGRVVANNVEYSSYVGKCWQRITTFYNVFQCMSFPTLQPFHMLGRVGKRWVVKSRDASPVIVSRSHTSSKNPSENSYVGGRCM